MTQQHSTNESETMTHRTKVKLSTGETLDVSHDDHRGVHTDAGCHQWMDVEAFVVWDETRQRWMTIPID